MKKLFSIALTILACGLIWCETITIEPFYLSKEVTRNVCGEDLVCVATQDSLIIWRMKEDLGIKWDLALKLPSGMWIDKYQRESG